MLLVCVSFGYASFIWSKTSPHQNKKAVSLFYHRKYFWGKMNARHPVGVLHSFSIKNIFYDKMDLRFFYFDVTIYRKIPKQCSSNVSTKNFVFSLTIITALSFEFFSLRKFFQWIFKNIVNSFRPEHRIRAIRRSQTFGWANR